MERPPTPFDTEAEMAPRLRPHIKDLAGLPVEWFTEVPAVNGIPDIVLVRFGTAELRRRKRHRLVMPDDLACVRTAMALTNAGTVAIPALAAATGLSVDLLRRRVLPDLRDTGWAVGDRDGWRMVQRYADPAQLLVTIELKLRDWKKALGQALQARIGSDHSWVVLGHQATKATEHLRHFEVRGVGLALLDQEQLRIVHPPQQLGYDPARRAVLAERVLAMKTAGVTDGPDRHVFGRMLTAAPS